MYVQQTHRLSRCPDWPAPLSVCAVYTSPMALSRRRLLGPLAWIMCVEDYVCMYAECMRDSVEEGAHC